MSELQVVRASKPAQWLTLVPYLLGFQPSESIVVLGTGGANGKHVKLTTRVDICEPEYAELLADQLIEPLHRAGARACQVFLYRDAPGPLSAADRELLDVLCDRLALDFDALDHLAVLGDRYYALAPCPNARCCPAEGRALPEPDERIRSELVFAGLSVAASRDEIVRRLARLGGPAEVLVAQRCDTHHELMLREVLRGQGCVLAWGREVRDALTACLVGPPAPLSTELLARFLVACTWFPIRDALLIPLNEHRDAAITMLIDVVRRAPRDWVAGPATLLGLLTSLRGDGAMANVAFDVALEADPDYNFALLLSHGLARGVRMPDDFITRTDDPLAG